MKGKRPAPPSERAPAGAVTVDPAVLGGEPVFRGTRVPVQALFDCLEAGDRLDDFLADFPTVTRDRTVLLIGKARTAIVADARPPR